MHKLYELKKNLCKALESYADEGVNKSNIDEIDKLAHATKNVCKVIEDAEMEEYSERYSMDEYSGRGYSMAEGGSYRGSYGDGSYRGSYEGSMESRWVDPMEPRTYEASSYARGRGRGAKRDSMGRYARDDGKHQKVVEELKELQRMSNNELDKEKYDSLIHLVESM